MREQCNGQAVKSMPRTARLMQAIPKYADCIVRRWQEYTGKEAALGRQGRSFTEVVRERLKESA